MVTTGQAPTEEKEREHMRGRGDLVREILAVEEEEWLELEQQDEGKLQTVVEREWRRKVENKERGRHARSWAWEVP